MTGNTKVLGLSEIADWYLKSREMIDAGACWAEIPSFQRGLVWSPAQIEVLWDSLMRGIPIGALSLLPMEGSERFGRSLNQSTLSTSYWLVDGQQRSNAIALGFAPFPSTNDYILWIDLRPDRSRRSRRKYFFYLTTPGRPWGYGITKGNDERRTELIPTDQYRRVLYEELNWRQGMWSKPKTFEMWPVKAHLPVPFCELRRLFAQAERGDFMEETGDFMEEFIKGPEAWREHFKKIIDKHAEDSDFIDNVRNEIKLIYKGLRRVNDTKTIGLIANGGLSGDEFEDGEADENSNIAVYFSRLNQGGTPPSKEDLDYSILKSVVPELSVLDQYAKEVMHPSRMATIAMLTYVSILQWRRSISRREIYQFQFNDKFKGFIVGDESSGTSVFKHAVDQVLCWIRYTEENNIGLPAVLCSSIAKNQPNLFRFLILFAVLTSRSAWLFDIDRMLALVVLLSWFGNDDEIDYAAACEVIKKSTSFDSFYVGMQVWLSRQIESHSVLIPPAIENFQNLRKATESGDPIEIKKAWNPPGYSEGLNQIWHWTSMPGRNFLLYVCREYLYKCFKDYDPASVIWNEDSRPWDYDHIFPKDWLQTGRGNKRYEYHDIVEEFIMSIGNIAPVPFSINRSKHDTPPCDYLGSDNSAVCVDLKCADGEPAFVRERPWLLEKNKVASCQLAFLTSNRWLALYNKLSVLPIREMLNGAIDPDRKSYIEHIKQKFSELAPYGLIRVVYHWPGDGLQYDVAKLYDWSRPWIACGIGGYYKENNSRIGKCFLCAALNKDVVQAGLRKHPAEAGFNGTNKDWVDGCSATYSRASSFEDVWADLCSYINGDKFEIIWKREK